MECIAADRKRDQAADAKAPIVDSAPADLRPAFQRAADRAVAFAKSGRRHALSRGSKSMYHADPAPIDTHTVHRLAQLHPLSSGDIPALPEVADIRVVDPDELAKVIKTMLANGSSPGVSKWTGEMIASLIETPSCLKGLAMLTQDIINGDIPRDAREILLSSRLVPIAKSDGGLRPIAMGESFYKLAALYVLNGFDADHMRAIFPEVQLGVGVAGGPEIAVHRIQAALWRTNAMWRSNWIFQMRSIRVVHRSSDLRR